MKIFKKLITGITATLMVSTLFLQIVSAESLFKNSDFSEITDKKSAPVGWTFNSWQNKGKIKVSTKNGENIVTLSSKEESDTRLIQSFTTEKDVIYKVSAKVKAKVNSINTWGANLSIYQRTDATKSFYDTKGKWETLEMYLKADSNVTLPISLSLGGHSNLNSGSASFKNVTLEKVTEVPAGASYFTISTSSTGGADAPTDGKGGVSPIVIIIVVVVLLVGAGAVVYFLPKKTADKAKEEKELPEEPKNDDFDQID